VAQFEEFERGGAHVPSVRRRGRPPIPGGLLGEPVAAAAGPGPVLATLIGVNVGPNLTYVGSLATLLWRRVMHAHDQATDVLEFTRLGAMTVPPVLLASTVLLWLALRIT